MLTIYFCLPFISLLLTYILIIFLKPRMTLCGKDLHKPNFPILPEAMGLSSALSFIISLFILMIFQERNIIFYNYLAISSSCIFTILLGFIDDVLDLEWKYKLIFPSISIIPTLLLYSEGTYVILPFVGLLKFGIFYYLYMIVCCTFATNAINILSGINGLEVMQILILSFFIFIDNIFKQNTFGCLVSSLLFFSSIPIYYFNKYPAQVFVGDTYCYFGGMVLSCVAILTHTTRTLFLLMGIQIINFLISLPQLFGIIKCPRHRMPDFDGVYLTCSKIHFGKNKIVNLTILNCILYLIGPMKENKLCDLMKHIQIIWCSIVILCKYFIYNKN